MIVQVPSVVIFEVKSKLRTITKGLKNKYKRNKKN